jgi:hypothetical protein
MEVFIMAYIRFNIDGAVYKPNYDALPAATKNAIRDKFLQLKALCSKINEGTPIEENTVRFKWHICHHDEGLSCEPEQDI